MDLTRTYEPGIDIYFKPHGLWYGLNNEWIEWCEDNTEGWVKSSIIELDIDLTNVLIIETIDQLKEFCTKYKIKYSPKMDLCGINWKEVEKQYTGIEIRNYYHLKNMLYNDNFRSIANNVWFFAWDVSSGCIWDLSIIKSYKQYQIIKKYDAGTT